MLCYDPQLKKIVASIGHLVRVVALDCDDEAMRGHCDGSSRAGAQQFTKSSAWLFGPAEKYVVLGLIPIDI